MGGSDGRRSQRVTGPGARLRGPARDPGRDPGRAGIRKGRAPVEARPFHACQAGSPSSRAISIRWTSLVPSPISRILESRHILATGYSFMKP